MNLKSILDEQEKLEAKATGGYDFCVFNQHLRNNAAQVREGVAKLVEELQMISQWAEEKESVVPREALPHYARNARAALKELGYGDE